MATKRMSLVSENFLPDIDYDETSSTIVSLEGTSKGLIPRYSIFVDCNTRSEVANLPKKRVIVVYKKNKIKKVALGKDITKTKWDDTSKYKYAELDLDKGKYLLKALVEHITKRPYFLGITTSAGMDIFHEVMKFLSTEPMMMPRNFKGFLDSYRNKGYNCLFDVKDLESNVLNIHALVGSEEVSEENKLNLSQIKHILKYCSEIKRDETLDDTLKLSYVSAFNTEGYNIKFIVTNMRKFRELMDSRQLDKKLNKKDLAILKVIEATNKHEPF